MGFENIPLELLTAHQWCTWLAIQKPNKPKPDKVPYSPTTGQMIDVSNPANWHSSQTCINAITSGFYTGIGFCFETGGKYTGIDLDHTTNNEILIEQQRWHAQLDSYSERSPSKLGLHVIVEGRVPKSRRTEGIEIYSDHRFFTMTGDVYNNKPVMERQKILTYLYDQLPAPKSNGAVFHSQPQTKSDEQVLNEGENEPGNGTRFFLLSVGKWQEAGYKSQSEADFAFIDMLANYSKNNEQIIRLFYLSELGKRPKAQRTDYINRMLERSRDQEASKGSIDFGAKITAQLSAVNSPREESKNEDSTGTDIEPAKPVGVKPPTGLVRAIAEFILAQATLPVQEMAVCASLALMAGICGRQYKTPTSAGLNLYTVLVGKTGTGKEAMSVGLQRLKNAVRQRVPAFDEFYGPSMISSGPALHKALSRKRSCLSISNEFGHQIQAMCAEHAPAHLISLRSMLLTIYSKSDRGHSLGSADYADAADNIPAIIEPAFSINSDTTRKIYEDLNEQQIALGLIPRLLIIEYHGGMVNENLQVDISPPQGLINDLGSLSHYVLTNAANNHFITVTWGPGSYELDQKFFKFVQTKVNDTQSEAVSGLWSRARLTIMKVASLLAIGENWISPTISIENWNWAHELVTRSVGNLVGMVERNDLGHRSNAEDQQILTIKKILHDYINKYLIPKKINENYRMTQEMIDDGIVSYKYFNAILGKNKHFVPLHGRLSTASQINNVIVVACKLGWLREIGNLDKSKYNSTGQLWQIKEIPK